jgi:membrane protease YdiL (CAAX protease family)
MTENDLNEILAAKLIDEVDRNVFYPNIKSTVILFFSFLLNILIAAIPINFISNKFEIDSPAIKSLSKMMLYIVPILLTIFYAAKVSKQQQGYSVKVNFNKVQISLVPVVIVGALSLVILLMQVSAWIPMPVSVHKLFEKIFTKDVFSIITAIIAAPILEEILCRGIVLKGLLKNYPSYKAIPISALFFAALHLNPWQAAPAFIAGLFLGWVYYKTDSVIPGMIIHATINIIATLFLFLPKNQQNLLNFFTKPYYLIVLFVSLIVFTAACIVIYKRTLVTSKAIIY